MELTIIRTYFPSGTNGKIVHEVKLLCHCIELPWKNNERRISCIPEGSYSLKKCNSAKFGEHIEITGVENRNLILFHPANNAIKELNGCIAPVAEITGHGCGLRSRLAFEKLKTLVFGALAKNEKVMLTIKSRSSGITAKTKGI
jgi:hypothetical protein